MGMVGRGAEEDGMGMVLGGTILGFMNLCSILCVYVSLRFATWDGGRQGRRCLGCWGVGLIWFWWLWWRI